MLFSLVPILLYKYNFMHMSSDLITYYLLERKAVCKPATIDITTRREETNAGTNANDIPSLFWPLFHSGNQFLVPAKNRRFLRFIHNYNS